MWVLQWGRGVIAAEGSLNLAELLAIPLASMGPRRDRRGRHQELGRSYDVAGERFNGAAA